MDFQPQSGFPVPDIILEDHKDLYDLVRSSWDHNWWIAGNYSSRESFPIDKEYPGFANLDLDAYWYCIHIQLMIYARIYNNTRVLLVLGWRQQLMLPNFNFERFELPREATISQSYYFDCVYRVCNFVPRGSSDEFGKPNVFRVEYTTRSPCETFYMFYVLYVYPWSSIQFYQGSYDGLWKLHLTRVNSEILPLPREIESWLNGDIVFPMYEFPVANVSGDIQDKILCEMRDLFMYHGVTLKYMIASIPV